MFVKVFRIIKYGLQSFLRNGWLSLSTIGIMILALAVFEGLILFNFVGKSSVESIKDKVDISVYFKDQVPEDAILRVKRTLEGLSEVKAVEYVSKEEALNEFKARHAGDEVITKTLEELEENPLLPSLNVKANDITQYGTIASYIETPALQDLLQKVTFEQNQVVIERLTRLIDLFKRGGFVLTVFLAFLAVTVTLTTISLAIFSDREQIMIMRLVGAPNSFIQGPYVIEGILYGLIASVFSFLILVPVIDFISPHIVQFVPGTDTSLYFTEHMFSFFLYQLLFGVLLGVISSSIAVRKYLKV